jgi:hypothetical protein
MLPTPGNLSNWPQAAAAAVPNLPALATKALTSPTAVLANWLATPLRLVKLEVPFCNRFIAPDPIEVTLVIGEDSRSANGESASAVLIARGTDSLEPIKALRFDMLCSPLCVYTWPWLALIDDELDGVIEPADTSPL